MKKTGKVKRIVFGFLISIAAIVLLLILGTGYMFKDEIAIIKTIRKMDDSPLYVMEFLNGYHLDEILAKNIRSDQELANVLAEYISHGFYKAPQVTEQHIGCSTLTAMNEDGHMVWGRNFDWSEAVPIIVKATPEDGYASISTCLFENITGDSTLVPEGYENSFMAVGAYFAAVDGINEKGLCVALLEVNEGGQVYVDTEKPDITVSLALRLLLDRAATVEEAITLLEQYDICPSGGISLHLSVSDSSGKSVAVEFMNGKIEVVDTPAVTNFNMKNGDTAAGGESAMDRYETLMEVSSESGGIMSRDEMISAMESVVQSRGEWLTRWTMIYENDESASVTYYRNGNLDHPVDLYIYE